MSHSKLCLGLLFAAASLARAAPPLTSWERVDIAPTKTSIYIGSVRLSTQTFERNGSTLSSTYNARVFPWVPWNEHGKIIITLSDSALANMAKGETAEFTGEAVNHRNKPRKVTGRVQPTSANTGKIKVRILADGIELVFNSTYQFAEVREPDRTVKSQ
ncbi:MAG: hypothetical protein JWQ83_2151 [Lacunisphaera sp.]|nr:hypothetical protein [Lacunisphaera sp.]MDB6167011.1 hypothetical protein [Lacunisphaera sp.]